jgi:hypothetical protein
METGGSTKKARYFHLLNGFMPEENVYQENPESNKIRKMFYEHGNK